jgi:rod shape-determining protein MreC
MPVITQQKALVGKISKVYADFSIVTLATNPDMSFDVKVGSDIDGLARGAGGSESFIDLVPKDKELKAGDPVYTNTLGGVFPGGLLVGTIKNVRYNDVETFRSASLAPAFDAGQARQVFIASVKSTFPEIENGKAQEK